MAWSASSNSPSMRSATCTWPISVPSWPTMRATSQLRASSTLTVPRE
jgi:hypothetical protein